MLTFFGKKQSGKINWTEMMSKLQSYLSSSSYQSAVSKLTTETPNLLTKVATKMAFALLNVYIKNEAEAVTKTQDNPCNVELDDVARRKVRYIGGYCIATSRYRCQRAIHPKLYKKSKQSEVTLLNTKVKLFDQVVEHESDICSKTDDPQSLDEILRKQGLSHGLTHINDNCFKFFLQLFLKCTDVISESCFHKFVGEMFHVAYHTLLNDSDLMKCWFSLFAFDQVPCTYLENDNDGALEFISDACVDMFSTVTRTFLKTYTNQWRKTYLEKVGKKSKKAHRTEVLIKKSGKQKTETPEPSTSKATANDDADEEDSFNCGICNKVCSECPEELSFQSIGCDGKCNMWYHYGCVGIQGNEQFLSRKRMKWYCPSCTKELPKKVKKSKKK